jgi:hypothetical protein
VTIVLRQLDERIGDGIVVQLLWDDSAPAGDDLSVEYRDERRGISYTLHPPRRCALEVFRHPNAYLGLGDEPSTDPASTRAYR